MKRFLTIMLSLALCISTMAACGGKDKGTAVSIAGTTSDTYPLETDKTITYWLQLDNLVMASYTNFGETPYAQQLQKNTGIKIEFLHPPTGQTTERLNLMISSDDMADIVEASWSGRDDIDRLIDDHIILNLNDAINKVSPNFKKYLDGNETAAKVLKSYEGRYYMYPFIREDSKMVTYAGPMIRKDLLSQTGEAMPETIEEWETVLYKFKDMGVEVPLLLPNNMQKGSITGIAPGFDVHVGFYLDNGKIKYGPYEKNYAEMLKTLSKWYKDGIINEHIFKANATEATSLVTTGKVGIAFGTNGANFGGWIPLLEKNIPGATLTPLKYPTAEKGKPSRFGQVGNVISSNGAVISGKSENAELCVRLLDYNWSEEGNRLVNYGIEGESFEFVDGVETYKPELMNSETNGGISKGEALAKYSRACYMGPFIQAYNYIKQYYTIPQQKEAMEVWTDNDAMSTLIPNLLFSNEENVEYKKIMSDVDTFVNENFALFVKGDLDTADMTEYYENLKKLGIERAIEIQQAAYDRMY